MTDSSLGSGLYGKPHSKRNGPIGENQRKPKPQLERRLVSGNNLTQGSPEICTFAGRSRQYCCSRLYEFPASVKITARIPTFSKIGTSISGLPTSCKLPPTRNTLRPESGD